ncbi:ATP-binding protein [Streptomyces sp. DSM 40750]|uniref:ATP-binding protein n=1 Tax=Streptomyces sp. DSM 40750 TaxID=2801030 RepID=UPI00214BFE1F|nr:LuxR C-terminal-related transcriptional regulator [Streptomyces sp. DSM 40750]UUU19185.1 LuxR C-terminal-related transcriptional regulator [Streptomyces sp. DSM 40750]UUU27471.1 LuxR C-terminal-related transcriptional regulator [Streptomyces sp. DSM 40750]
MDERRAARPPGNLPVIASSFVGRRQELGDVRRWLETTRLLTLTGPGGVGKTRLAVRAAELARRAFPHGVWFADLAAVDDPDRLADAVMVALGVKDQSLRAAKEQLADHLADRRLLLVLDNCEHLAVACAGLVDHLLRRAPGLRVLATSRQPLGVPGEHVRIVDPLPVPAGAPSAEALVTYESVALFVDRATAVQPGFGVRDDNRAAVARLCARLDGLPLAIELAATRLRSLSVEQVADRLDDRFLLLTLGSPAAVSRQQTLRALMEWSYDLCSEQERLLWAGLSVFPAEFDLAAVEGICAGPGTGIDAADVIDLVDGLVAKSVVSARPQLPQARYRMLETIRHYGRGILAGSGLEHDLRRRHRDHYLGLAVHACETWPGPGQGENLARLNLERDNLASALDWSLSEPGEIPSALLLVVALRYHWTVGEQLAQGRRRLDQVLRAAPELTPDRGHALWVAAWIALLQGDGGAAAGRLRECAAIAERYDDDRLRGHVLVLSGSIALFAGDPSGAARLFEEGIELIRAQDDVAAVLWGLFQRSVALSMSGDSASAQVVGDEAIRLARERGETWARSEAMWACAFDHWVTGDRNADAAGLVREALALTPTANQLGMALDAELLAWIAESRSHHDEAARLLGAATALWDSLGTGIEAFGPVFSHHSAQCRANTRAALGDGRFGTLLDEGRHSPTDTLRLPGPAVRSGPPKRGGPPKRSEEQALTRREQEVARLITRGMTNKAIAAELVLSPRTVDGHVERLFDKIGVNSRAQVAVWMARVGRDTAERNAGQDGHTGGARIG